MINEEFLNIIDRASNENTPAREFCILLFDYFHYVDDIVDGDIDDRTTTNATGLSHIKAVEVFSHPFWVDFGGEFKSIVITAISKYLLSEEDKEHSHADFWRSQGNDIIAYVAYICHGGDFDVMQEVAKRINALSVKEQHNG